MSIQRFYIDREVGNVIVLKEAIKYATQISKVNPEIRKITFLVPSMDGGDLFTDIFGSQISRRLKSGYKFHDQDVVFKIETVAEYKDLTDTDEIIIACWLKDEDLFKIDGFSSIDTIICIPWLRQSVQTWIKQAAAINTNENELPDQPSERLSCIAQTALDELTSAIGRSLQVNGQELIKTYLLTLYQNKVPINEEAIGVYLFKNSEWEMGSIQYLQKLIYRLNNKKRFPIESLAEMPVLCARWEEACEL